MVLRGIAGGGHPGERCRCIRGGWSETGRLKITGGSGGRVIARQALFCREAVALAPHADPERMGGLRAVSAVRPDPTPTNVTDGIPGVDPCRSLHGIIAAPHRFAPTADRLHRNAPFVRSIAKSGIGRRDPAAVQEDGKLPWHTLPTMNPAEQRLFTPGSGAIPPALTGREPEQAMRTWKPGG